MSNSTGTNVRSITQILTTPTIIHTHFKVVLVMCSEYKSFKEYWNYQITYNTIF